MHTDGAIHIYARLHFKHPAAAYVMSLNVRSDLDYFPVLGGLMSQWGFFDRDSWLSQQRTPPPPAPHEDHTGEEPLGWEWPEMDTRGSSQEASGELCIDGRWAA